MNRYLLNLYQYRMIKKGQNHNDDPYELIKSLRIINQEQKQALQQYELILDSLLNQKNIAINQISELKKQIQYLKKKLEAQTNKERTINNNHTNQGQDNYLRKYQSNQFKSVSSLSLSSSMRKHQIANSHFIVFGSPQNTLKKMKSKAQFIPNEVKFNKKRQNTFANQNVMNESVSQLFNESIGDFLVEDFLLISIDIQELKRKRQQHKEQNQLKIHQYSYFNINKNYKTKKVQYLKDIATRSFPLGATAIKKTVYNIQEFKTQMEYTAERTMNQDVFIVNLKGDFSQPPLSQRIFLGNCNPFKCLFAICLRVPDFVPIRDEKHYQRTEQQIWKVQKIYAIMTYYPFLQLHLSIIAKIHEILKPKWHNLHRQEMFGKNLAKNISDAQKNEQLKKLIYYFMNKQPNYNLICEYEKEYFGTLPNFGKHIQYAFPRYACSIFFSIFAYEELLLLLTALFLQKSIIFISKNDSAATLCALFLATCISPFVYNHHLILNCNAELIQNIVFSFPMPLIASLKKDNVNFQNILSIFIDNSVDYFKGFQGNNQSPPHILVDIDSNIILYDRSLNNIFEQTIVEPNKQFRQAYHQVNPSHSKSFTFTKKMPVEISTRPKNGYQKNAEQKKKLLKEYQNKIDNNTSKWPKYKVKQCHLQVLDLLIQYINSFTLDRQSFFELSKYSKQSKSLQAKNILLKKHPQRSKFIQVISKSQIFADYLDQLEKIIQNPFHN